MNKHLWSTLLCGFALLLVSGCGDKITVPEAVGIPSSSSYVDVTPRDLEDELGDVSDVLSAFEELFVCEADSGRVLRITSDGRVNTVFGPPARGLAQPVALAADDTRRMILVGEQNGGAPAIAALDFLDLSLVDRFDVSADVQSIAGMAVSGNSLYVSDPQASVVHRFELSGLQGITMEYRGAVATGESGNIESPQSVFEPSGLTLDEEGLLLVCDADTTRNWVLRFDPVPLPDDPQGTGRATPFDTEVCADGNPSLDSFTLGIAPRCGDEFFVGGPSSEQGGFSRPSGAAVDDDGRIYVADRDNGRIQRFDADGRFDAEIGRLEGTDRGLEEPIAIATWLGERVVSGTRVRIPGARLFVIDAASGRLRVFEDLRWTQINDTGS